MQAELYLPRCSSERLDPIPDQLDWASQPLRPQEQLIPFAMPVFATAAASVPRLC